MTLEELEEKPLRRGDFLIHAVGLVRYCAKVRNHPDKIVVRPFDENAVKDNEKAKRIQVHISSVSRGKPAGKRQGSMLILALCLTCNLKIRASGSTYAKGSPLCFNNECPDIGKPLEIEWGERGDGILGFDRAERIRQANHENAGTLPEENGK